jgi:acyl-CoA synthetase (AMP-forming)/AMP-acid ligase II
MAWPLVERLVGMRVTGFAGVPTLFASLLSLKDLGKADLSALRYLTNAAYGLPAAQVVRLRELLPHVAFFAMYGQTECTRVSYLPPDQALTRPGSVGIAFPNEELWIERDDGTRAAPGEVGELVVRGPNVMRGYYRDPEATARALRPGPFPGELVLHEKVSPFEVESVIARLSGVVEVAVVGAPDRVLGLAVKAVIVRAPGAEVAIDDVRRLVRAELDEVAVPKVVEFVDALPRTASGKVKKSELV